MRLNLSSKTVRVNSFSDSLSQPVGVPKYVFFGETSVFAEPSAPLSPANSSLYASTSVAAILKVDRVDNMPANRCITHVVL